MGLGLFTVFDIVTVHKLGSIKSNLAMNEGCESLISLLH